MDVKLLYKKALDLWGKDLQLNMAFEELGELITTLSRVIRGREKPEALVEEIADVEIMLEQLKFILNLDNEVYHSKLDKLRRLAETIIKSHMEVEP